MAAFIICIIGSGLAADGSGAAPLPDDLVNDPVLRGYLVDLMRISSSW